MAEETKKTYDKAVAEYIRENKRGKLFTMTLRIV